MDLDDVLENGVTIKSSGTTGEPKQFFQSPEKLDIANTVANVVQSITPLSKVYTVCKLDHAGGLLAQTLPAHSIGAEVTVETFNAYRFVKVIKDYTHSHLTPDHARAILGTKGFDQLDLTGIVITCGSDRVTWDIIEAFVTRGCQFIVNWGMSEIGPVAINHKFNSLEEVEKVKALCPEGTTLMGSTKYCYYKVSESGELSVKGDICIFDDWYQTGDIVVEKDEFLFYLGRKNLNIFHKPNEIKHLEM